MTQEIRQAAGFDKDLLEIYSELSRDRLMELVVRYACDRLGSGGSSVFIRDDITGCYVLRGTTGILDTEGLPPQRIEYGPGEGLTGWIARHGRPLRIADPMDEGELRSIADDLSWSRKYSEISAESGLAYLGVPILSRDGATVLGVLRVSGKAQDEEFTAQDEALLNDVAALVSIAIENSQRYEREKRRARYFWLLLDISSELNPRRPIPEILQSLVDRVKKGFRTEDCQVYLRSEEDVHRVVLRATSGLPADLIGKLTYTMGEGLTGSIVHTGQAVQVRDVAALEEWDDPHIAEMASHLPSGCYRSFLGVPLRLGDEILGAIELVNKIPSSPGHRDWFTDDDEVYVRLLSTSVGGVLEGARYLKALNDVSVSTMRMQRVASFGTLAQRILHETANPLAVARLAASNLCSDLRGALAPPAGVGGRGTLGDKEPVGTLTAAQLTRIARRLNVIETSLNKVSGKLLDLLKFSQRIGFVRSTTQWNDVVREVLIWLAAERQRRECEIHVNYGDVPPLFVEPNELFGVLVTVLRLAMEAIGPQGGLIEVCTIPSADGQQVCTKVCAPDAPLVDRILGILEPVSSVPEDLSPVHFEWALSREIVEGQYAGHLTCKAEGGGVCFELGLPLRGN
jgi:GAF domain-containing protein